MPKLTIDLTGKKGLAPRYYGDKVYTTSKPNLRYEGGTGQVAEGIYNPLTVLGYMSPANNTTKVVTGTTSFLLSSAIVVPSRLAANSTDAIFFGDEAVTGTAGKVVNLDTAIDTSLDTALTITNFENPAPTFYINFGDASKDWIFKGFTVNPASSTRPTVIYSERDNNAASSTTLTKSITVPAGTDKELFVLAYSYTTEVPASATWDGNAMTSVSSGTFGATEDISFRIFRYNAPATATGDVVITWGSATIDRGVDIFVTDNTDQTTPIGTGQQDTGTNDAFGELVVDQTASNQLRAGWLLSEITTHTKRDITITEVLNANNDSGTSSLWTYALDTQYFKAEDFIKYSINGEPKIFWFRTDTTTTSFNSIAIADLDFSNADEDWSIAEHELYLSCASRPFFILGDNNTLYALDSSTVYSIDGTVTGGATGTITQVLQFLGKYEEGESPSDITRLIDGIDTRGRMWIGLHVYPDFDVRTNSLDSITTPQFVGVYVWDRLSTVASMQDFIRIGGAKEFKSMHSIDGNPVCFTISTDGYTQIREWTGSSFRVVQKLGKNAYPNYRRHSVYEDENGLMWLGNDGYVYLYGTVEGNEGRGIYIIGDMTGHVTAGQTYVDSGVFTPANATETVTSGNEAEPLAFYLSFTDTAGNHLKKWYPFSYNTVATVDQKPHIGNAYSLIQLMPGMSKAQKLIIRCAPATSKTGTTIATVKVYLNNSTTATATSTVTDTEASRGYVKIKINGKKYINTIQVEVEWAIAETLGVDTFLPYMAILDYNETNIEEK